MIIISSAWPFSLSLQTDMEYSDMFSSYKRIPDDERNRTKSRVFVADSLKSYPDSIDWRTKGAVTGIKTQVCWFVIVTCGSLAERLVHLVTGPLFINCLLSGPFNLSLILTIKLVIVCHSNACHSANCLSNLLLSSCDKVTCLLIQLPFSQHTIADLYGTFVTSIDLI